MKKQAHTLSEVLIALGIVGILGAVVAPMANKFKPDVNKIKFLKNYDAIVQANNDMIYHKTLYREKAGEYEFVGYPIFDILEGAIGETTYDEGNVKYCQVLSDYITGDVSSECSEEFLGKPDGDPMFTSKYGTDFWIYSARALSEENYIGTYHSDIYIDVDGTGNGKDCQYSTDCLEPDIFKLSVKASGEVIPSDAMSVYYLRTRTNYRLNTVREIADFVIDNAQFVFPITRNCGSGKELVNNECLDKCEDGLVRQLDGTCAKAKTDSDCTDDQELIDGVCLTKCAENEERINGECLTKCADGETRIGKTCQGPIEPTTICSQPVYCEHCGLLYYPAESEGFCPVLGNNGHLKCGTSVTPE